MSPFVRRLIGAAGAASCAALLWQLSVPATPLAAFSLTGHALGTDQRDFRVFDNFADASAHDNLVEHPAFPGSTGAVLALRKAHAEWGSAPRDGSGHGDGLADNAVLGGAGANFDQLFLGEATALGGPTSNMHHAASGGLCSGSVVAFTQITTGGGWRITYCEEVEWSDGPGRPEAGQFDLQAVATREIGRTLGLGTSAVSGATMSPFVVGDGTRARSIEADDVAGLQAIYGVAAASKPRIATVLGGAGVGATLEIQGSQFHATANEVWFTPADAGELPVVVSGVPSSAGGTRILVGVPAGVASGDLLVRVPGTSGAALSNAWPFEAGAAQEAVAALATGLAGGTGEAPQLTAAGDLTPGSATGFDVDVQLAAPFTAGLLFVGAGVAAVPFKGGVFVPLPILAELPFATDGDGALQLHGAIMAGVPAGTSASVQAWFADASGPAGVTGTNGLVLTVP